MAKPSRDTIFALSTALGRAAIAVIRLSGPESASALHALTLKPRPAPREAALRTLFGPDGEPFDQSLALWFEGPASFTGEDMVELHVHGGRSVVAATLAALSAAGLRPAEPGEFTRRAVENGKLDLLRAEAIADLVAAETEAQRRQALRQFDGGLSALIEAWRTELKTALAWAEAAIDFSDEELPGGLPARSAAAVAQLLANIRKHLADGRRGELLRDGLHLTVIGPPNVGKSTLVNLLAQRDVAIVSEIAGTTRDIIEVHLNLGGYPVIVSDTAGLRRTQERIEAEGVRRALARSRDSDIVVLLLDGASSDPLAGVSRETAEAATLIAWNKADLPWRQQREGLTVSLKTGAGVLELISALTVEAEKRLEMPGEAAPVTRERHRKALLEAEEALARGLEAGTPELFAEDLRLALRAFGRITGAVDVEELLDVIFRDFCLGK